jgi:hypothetical protein
MWEAVVVAEAPGYVAGLGLNQPQVARPVLHERNQEEPGSSLMVEKFNFSVDEKYFFK